MNKQMKQSLEAVLDAIVENDTAAAKAAFHEYLCAKTHTILLGEEADEEEKCDECGKMECECDEDADKKEKKEEKVDKSLDKVEKDVKKAKKAQAEDEKKD